MIDYKLILIYRVKAQSKAEILQRLRKDGPDAYEDCLESQFAKEWDGSEPKRGFLRALLSQVFGR